MSLLEKIEVATEIAAFLLMSTLWVAFVWWLIWLVLT
jgi:hypothetical protein